MRTAEPERPMPTLEFAWLELTNRCNLTCVHCYAESGPHAETQNALTPEQYAAALRSIRGQGCRQVQFIGGEPTLNKALPSLIRQARELDFDLIEVFTNLYKLDEHLLACFVEHDVSVATSFYSHEPATHDAITTRKGSFERTVANILRVLRSGLRLRAGIIVMDENRSHVEETRRLLADLGVTQIGLDRLRDLGRASDTHSCDVGELCGNCAGNIISIGPDGSVTPCAMSKALRIGSIIDEDLSAILSSRRLEEIRGDIREAAKRNAAMNTSMGGCAPCGPNGGPCNPNGRGCNPGGRWTDREMPSVGGCYPCGPNGGPCNPNGRGCNPG